MAAEHQQADAPTHAHERAHGVTQVESGTYRVHTDTGKEGIREHCSPPVGFKVLNVFLLHFSASDGGRTHAQPSDMQLTPPQSSRKRLSCSAELDGIKRLLDFSSGD